MASARLSKAANVVHVLVAAAMIFGVALVNGRPAAFPDTAFYYSQGEYAGDWLGVLSPGERARTASDPTSIVEDARRPPPTPLDAMAGARSPAYGAFLYFTVKIGGLWLTAFAQALAAALALFLLVKAAVRERPVMTYYALIGGLTLGSSLPFTALLAMPDLFDAVAVVAAVTLMAYFDRLSGWDRTILWILLVFSAACHTTHLIAAIIVCATALALLRRAGSTRAAAVATSTALVVAVLANMAYAAAFTARTGHTQRLPPFLTARVLADGPGRSYLAAACDRGADFALCAFRGQPLDDEEHILWAVDPRQSVFTTADVQTRLRLEREQTRFVIGAVAAHPLREFAAALTNGARQLASFYVAEPLRNPSDFFPHPLLRRTRIIDIIPGAAACRPTLRTCPSPFPFGALAAWHQTVVLAALAFLGWRGTKPDVGERLKGGDPQIRRVLVVIILFAVAILVNALVCGAIAGVFPRYGARLIWLVPAAAALFAAVIGPWPAPRNQVPQPE